MKTFLNEMRSFIPGAKPNTRNATRHVRATVNDIQIDEFKKRFSFTSDKDTTCSNTYLTHRVVFDNDVIPVVLSNKQFKTSKGSILQKQLTPTKLGIYGEYTNLDFFVNRVSEGFSNVDIDTDTRDMLLNILNHVSYGETIDKFSLYKASKRAIDKDYGEILAGAHVIRMNGNVTFAEGEASAFYDLTSIKDKNLIKYNVKSGSGSGQSFKSVIPNGSGHCVDLIHILQEKLVGREKLHKYVNRAKDKDSPIYDIMTNLQIQETKDQFISMMNTISQKTNDECGVPKKFDIYNAEDAYLFAGCTLISHHYPIDLVTDSLKNNDIRILHIRSGKDNIYIQEPSDIKYKMHYWGNYAHLYNNFPGFKGLYYDK